MYKWLSDNKLFCTNVRGSLIQLIADRTIFHHKTVILELLIRSRWNEIASDCRRVKNVYNRELNEEYQQQLWIIEDNSIECQCAVTLIKSSQYRTRLLSTPGWMRSSLITHSHSQSDNFFRSIQIIHIFTKYTMQR